MLSGIVDLEIHLAHWAASFSASSLTRIGWGIVIQLL
jgi:hypothetical protein